MMPARPARLKRARHADDSKRVIEALLVLFGVGVLALAGIGLPLLPAPVVVMTGAVCIGGGLLIGVPTGLWYHVKLHACLRDRGPVPARWWLRPATLHSLLAPDVRAVVLLWFYAGGAGFFVTVAGCTLVVAGVFLEGFRAGIF